MIIQEQLYCVTASDDSETRGAGAELLAALGYELSSWKDEESGNICHTLYFNTLEAASAALTRLTREAPAWREFGVELNNLRQAVLKKEDWAEVWKIHFRAMEISPRLVVRPSWETYAPKKGQHVMELDPGMSFGTGQHATTKSCLKFLDRFTAEAGSRILSMLDAGSGTGILAIAAYLFGCRPITAFDIDPDTLPIAKENASGNRVPADAIVFQEASLYSFQATRQYDLVAANILSSALLAGREKLRSLVAPGGHLMLAGILDSEYIRVKEAFEEIGFEQLETIGEKEWRSGAFLLKS